MSNFICFVQLGLKPNSRGIVKAPKAYVLISSSVHPLKDNSRDFKGEVAAPPRTLLGITFATLAPCGVQEALTQASRH